MAKSNAIFFYDQMLDRASNTVRVYQNKPGDIPIEIVRGFYRDDFHISVANQWQSGDATIVKSLVDAAAGFVTGRSGKMASDIIDKGAQVIQKEFKLSPGAQNAIKEVRDITSKAKSYQNAAYFTADDYFKSFKGTTVSYPTNIQLTLVSDEYMETDAAEVNRIDIFQKLKLLMDASVGDYETIASNWIGIQKAPNGFESGSYDLTDEIKGTLKVIYGDPDAGGFSLKNMVISNVHYTFSKSKVKIAPNKYRPLYIDIQLMMEPAKKFTKTDILESIGKGINTRSNTNSKVIPANEADLVQNRKDELTLLDPSELIDEIRTGELRGRFLENKVRGRLEALKAAGYDVNVDGVEYDHSTNTINVTGTVSDFNQTALYNDVNMSGSDLLGLNEEGVSNLRFNVEPVSSRGFNPADNATGSKT